ncbi:hypothetical protein [Denitrobaculum tricleocarpae]|uniref:Uncharacterized protein n=1 Tax=Denitrobaculum tricleocarpae TaxID=2591009 RepID=A0A545TSX8_9PROT|nr:hypothetical protein [Denitrobaculum tricleocarpae]TQV80318.1 hypothetical protein FKG95_08980 [Denitrobaculum tricleocarpae]
MPRIPFATQSYQSVSVELSAQRLVNLYPETAPASSKAPYALFGTPGLSPYQEVGTGPIRGMHNMKGSAYVVSGTALWKVESNGDTRNLGFIPGTGPVQMDNNGLQVGILTGTEADDLFMATATSLTQVNDADYTGASSIKHLDGYFVFTRPNSGQFFISGLRDGLAYDALEFATAEGSPDGLVTAAEDHRELWLFGETSTEIWYNSGNVDFPFERTSGAYLERGCIAAASVQNLDNSLFWVGDDRIVYRAEGYTPRRISTHAIEKVLTENLGLGDLTSFAYTQNGHAFYVLKKPNVFTFVYDVATGLWHERASHQREDYRVSTFVTAFDRLLVGDDQSGMIYELDMGRSGTEGSDCVIARAAAPPLWAEAMSATMNNLVIDVEGGVGLTTGQGSDPQIMLRYSDDGGHTWSNEKWRSMGRKGRYKRRARWDGLGQFRQRVLEVAISDPVGRIVLGAYAEMEQNGL